MLSNVIELSCGDNSKKSGRVKYLINTNNNVGWVGRLSKQKKPPKRFLCARISSFFSVLHQSRW